MRSFRVMMCQHLGQVEHQKGDVVPHYPILNFLPVPTKTFFPFSATMKAETFAFIH